MPSKKITITERQAKQFNHMLMRLRRIAKDYQTPDQLRRNGEKQYGPSYEECLEMAYENIQEEAKSGAKGVSPLKFTVSPPSIKKQEAMAEARQMAHDAGMSQSDFDKQQTNQP